VTTLFIVTPTVVTVVYDQLFAAIWATSLRISGSIYAHYGNAHSYCDVCWAGVAGNDGSAKA
jgi:hypothetical protein